MQRSRWGAGNAEGWVQVPAEPCLLLLNRSFNLSRWDLSHLTLVIKSNCLATHVFLLWHVPKGNEHQKKVRPGRRKLFCQVTLLEIKTVAELILSGVSGTLCIHFNRLWGKTEGLQLYVLS